MAAFFSESILSCGGQVVLPDGYLRDVYEEMRSVGAVCVADEVHCQQRRHKAHVHRGLPSAAVKSTSTRDVLVHKSDCPCCRCSAALAGWGLTSGASRHRAWSQTW